MTRASIKTWVKRLFSVFLIVEEIQILLRLLEEHRVTAATIDAYRKQIEFLQTSHDANKQLIGDEKENIKRALEGKNLDLQATLKDRTELLIRLGKLLEQQNKTLEVELAKYKLPRAEALAEFRGLAPRSLLGGFLQSNNPKKV